MLTDLYFYGFIIGAGAGTIVGVVIGFMIATLISIKEDDKYRKDEDLS